MGVWLIPALGFLGKALGASAVAFAGSAMWKWSGENVEQTYLISGDRNRQMDIQEEDIAYKQDHLEYLREQLDYYRGSQQTRDWVAEQELSIRIAELNRDIQNDIYYRQQQEVNYLRSLHAGQMDFDRDISKMAVVEGFDRLDRMQEANIEFSRQQHQVGLWEAKARQIELDNENYILDNAMQTQLDTAFGEPEDMTTVAHILKELYRIASQERPIFPQLQDPQISSLPSIDEEYDYLPTNALTLA